MTSFVNAEREGGPRMLPEIVKRCPDCGGAPSHILSEFWTPVDVTTADLMEGVVDLDENSYNGYAETECTNACTFKCGDCHSTWIDD